MNVLPSIVELKARVSEVGLNPGLSSNVQTMLSNIESELENLRRDSRKAAKARLYQHVNDLKLGLRDLGASIGDASVFKELGRSVHQEAERAEAAIELSSPRVGEGQAFAILAYLYENGTPDDLVIVEEFREQRRFAELDTIAERVSSRLEFREMAAKREALMQEYHELVDAVNRRRATPEGKKRLCEVTIALDELEEQQEAISLHAAGRDSETVRSRIDAIQDTLNKILERLRDS